MHHTREEIVNEVKPRPEKKEPDDVVDERASYVPIANGTRVRLSKHHSVFAKQGDEFTVAEYSGKGQYNLKSLKGGWLFVIDGGYLEPLIEVTPENIRTFSTGATRNLDTTKLDYEGFLSPNALQEFAAYMHKHRAQADGSIRDSDNWQKGIPEDVYLKSMFRHFMDLWTIHRGGTAHSPEDNHTIDRKEALCALMFNVQGLLHELTKP